MSKIKAIPQRDNPISFTLLTKDPIITNMPIITKRYGSISTKKLLVALPKNAIRNKYIYILLTS